MTRLQRWNHTDAARRSLTSALVAIELRKPAEALVCCVVAVVHLTYLADVGEAESIVERFRRRARA